MRGHIVNGEEMGACEIRVGRDVEVMVEMVVVAGARCRKGAHRTVIEMAEFVSSCLLRLMLLLLLFVFAFAHVSASCGNVAIMYVHRLWWWWWCLEQKEEKKKKRGKRYPKKRKELR